jgi:hypothetical protein
MLADTLFHTYSSGWKKSALLLNIPCAILPMLMALGAFLSQPQEWAYFKFDILPATMVYVLYVYGLVS